MSTGNIKVLAVNKKARFNYHVEEVIECGVVLQGTEVKSMRANHFNFSDAFAEIDNGELWLKNLSITPYAFGNRYNHEAIRIRKLLVHRREIEKLKRRVDEKGYTLIPIRFYLKDSRVKVELGVCKGKKLYDKRETIKEKDMKRDTDRAHKYT